jgi:hypothetical protein
MPELESTLSTIAMNHQVGQRETNYESLSKSVNPLTAFLAHLWHTYREKMGVN